MLLLIAFQYNRIVNSEWLFYFMQYTYMENHYSLKWVT